MSLPAQGMYNYAQLRYINKMQERDVQPLWFVDVTCELGYMDVCIIMHAMYNYTFVGVCG